MSSSQMPPEVEARIRALPGNTTCADCNNVNPQWASVSYGSLVCLECSGQHRSLGVHLSFVRSVQMDSWSEKQIAAMERSGGNTALVDFLRSKGIEKTMRIPQKYNTKQAAYFKERLTRWLEGKTEPPPDPGRYDPATGGSEAQGAEPLPGETTDQYNERQARLREEARERLRLKFGQGGLGAVSSSPQPSAEGFGDGLLGSAVGAVGGVFGGAVGFVRNNVLENEQLHSVVKGTVGSLADLTSGAVGSIRQTVLSGDVVGTLKRNATFEEGSTVSKSLGWTVDTVGSIWEKSPGLSDLFGDDGGAQNAPQAPRCSQGHALRAEPRGDLKCSLCRAVGTRYACSQGCTYEICTKCFEKPTQVKSKKEALDSFDFDDESWGADKAPPPPDPTKEDMERMAKEMGMKLEGSGEPKAASRGHAPVNSPSRSPEPRKSASVQPDGSPTTTSSIVGASPTKPKAKAALASADDFFGEFGM